MMVTRLPRSALRPFVGSLWASDGRSSARVPRLRERVLPTGEMHVALRLSEPPFRFLDDAFDRVGSALGHSVVGGARITPYFKDVSGPAASVGARLLPGASAVLLGAPAMELAGGHVPLEALWGVAAEELRERLMEVRSIGRRLDLFEDALAQRLPPVRGLHPAVAHALERFRTGAPVGDVVGETGYSHRHFIHLFRSSVGLAPKVFCRVRRFQRALVRLSAGDLITEVAFEAGYSDQAHLTREFHELAGLTPGEYRRSDSRRPGHVAIG